MSVSKIAYKQALEEIAEVPCLNPSLRDAAPRNEPIRVVEIPCGVCASCLARAALGVSETTKEQG